MLESKTERAGAAFCLNCKQQLSGPWCSACGQEAKPPLTALNSAVSELLQDFGSLDFRVVRTLRLLLTRPGALTLRYTSGQRAPFTPPFRLYIAISAISIALMSWMGVINIDRAFSDTSAAERAQLEQLIGMDLSVPGVAERFDRRFNTLFPLLNLVTPFGLALALKLVRRRRLFHEHLIAGLHLATAQVLVTTILVPASLAGPMVQTVLGLLVIGFLIAYAWIFVRRMYGGSAGHRLLLLLALIVSYVLIAGVISMATLTLVRATI